jgi:hypothetical protein
LTRRSSNSPATPRRSRTRPCTSPATPTSVFRIETRWTNEAPAKYQFELEDLADLVNLARLRAVFWSPEELRSGRTRDKLTKEAAEKFQTISDSLQHRNPDNQMRNYGRATFMQP